MRLSPSVLLVPTLISTGYGACPFDGSTTETLKSIDLLGASTCTEIFELATVPDTFTRSGEGFAPKMYASACFRISSRRQCQSAFEATRVPSNFRKGSGSLVIFVVSDFASGTAATWQSALSSSTARD